ncbi:MAG: hypothetical protein JWN62_1268 [Acidimicrobiales bacterium]|nr:hypothetical protein [Acidimicrobiales bacterium]
MTDHDDRDVRIGSGLDPSIDPALETHVRDVLHAVAATTPTQLGGIQVSRVRQRRARPVTIAAAVLVLAGAVGGVLIATHRTADAPAPVTPAAAPTTVGGAVPTTASAAPPTTVSTPAGPVTMLPAALPAGFTLGGDVLDEDLPNDHIQRRVYARAAAPNDASSWVNIWFSIDQLGVTCDGQVEEQSFTIGEVAAATCLIGGRWTSAVWKMDGVTVDVTASSAVTRDELVAFARSLSEVPVASPAAGQPPFNLVPSSTDTWTALAGDDITVGRTVHSTLWFANSTGDQPAGMQVWTWAGAPEEAKYIIEEPLDVTTVQVAGHDAYFGTDGDGNPLATWWVQDDGLVVMVAVNGPVDQPALLAFASSLYPADAAALAAFATAAGFAVVHPTP